MQFQVPQFIDTEDKILGPLTMKQFAATAGVAIVLALLFPVFEFWLWTIFFIVLIVPTAILVFWKPNGRPASVLAMAIFKSIWSPSVYKYRVAGDASTESRPVAPAKVMYKQPSGIKSLIQRINTSKTAIPNREKPLRSSTNPYPFEKERFQTVTHITGDREVAKRIDYRQ